MRGCRHGRHNDHPSAVVAPRSNFPWRMAMALNSDSLWASRLLLPRGSGYGLDMDEYPKQSPVQAFSDESDRMDSSFAARENGGRLWHSHEGAAVLVLVFLVGTAVLDALVALFSFCI